MLSEVKQIQLKAYNEHNDNEGKYIGTCLYQPECIQQVKDELYTYIRDSEDYRINNEDIQAHLNEQQRIKEEAIAAEQQAIKDAIKLLDSKELLDDDDCLTLTGVEYIE